ncbi:hypothetical protein [Buchnera aphidicola]|uniref:Uncharacterized protein n=1 Tax=Buchnera aphidicola (Aphis nerii) TaxID=1241835 RepID=A0A4D6XX04_9GAMM|nr:hypothetical protein [Buchnera aphidicola]QCI19048.1 hypothetical protein D9V64_02715 [Buchnera aphidicola (Aphis nerii)]
MLSNQKNKKLYIKIKQVKKMQNKTKKIYNQKKHINELKKKILLHQIEIKKIHETICDLSKQLNYMKLYINQLLASQRPPHY